MSLYIFTNIVLLKKNHLFVYQSGEGEDDEDGDDEEDGEEDQEDEEGDDNQYQVRLSVMQYIDILSLRNINFSGLHLKGIIQQQLFF